MIPRGGAKAEFKSMRRELKAGPKFSNEKRVLVWKGQSSGSPGPAQYTPKSPLNIAKRSRTSRCLFGNSYEKYRKTMDAEPHIKIFNCDSHPGPKYKIKTPTKAPKYSLRDQLFNVFHPRNLKGYPNPGPSDYNVDE